MLHTWQIQQVWRKLRCYHSETHWNDTKLCDMVAYTWYIVVDRFYKQIIFVLCRIINSTMFEFPQIIEMFPMYYLYNALLCILQVLHVIWFTMILRMVYAYVIKGKVNGLPLLVRFSLASSTFSTALEVHILLTRFSVHSHYYCLGQLSLPSWSEQGRRSCVGGGGDAESFNSIYLIW